MNNLITEQTKETKIEPLSLNWLDNSSVQKLLDVIVSIIAEEYIQVAKQNPDVFMDSRFRGNDNGKGQK